MLVGIFREEISNASDLFRIIEIGVIGDLTNRCPELQTGIEKLDSCFQ